MYVGGDVAVREVTHTQGVTPEGVAVEHLAIQAGAGTAAYYVLAVPPAPVIPEMQVSVPVRATREGVQLFVSVVLPRMRHPQSGQVLTLLLRGGQYRVPGNWESLTLVDLPGQLERESRMLRFQLRCNIDTREAYVDGVVLNLYGGIGTTEVSLGPVQLRGFLPQTLNGQPKTGFGGSPIAGGGNIGQSGGYPVPTQIAPAASDPAGPHARDWVNTSLATHTESWAQVGKGSSEVVPAQHVAPPAVELAGSVLRVNGRPFFPRAIEYRGEPLDLIKKLGFNTVWIRQPVEDRVLGEARQLGLFVIFRPDQRILVPEQGIQRTIGPLHEVVIGWDLGRQSSPQEVTQLKDLAEQLRSVDPLTARPLLAEPLTSLLPASRAVDVLLIGRNPCFGDLELTDYGTWLRSRPLLARPGTPIWVTIPTQPDRLVLTQWQQFGVDSGGVDFIPAEQLRLLTYLALTAGARGLLFTSYSPLDSQDEGSGERRIALELLNHELEWIDPFLAAGQFISIIPSDQPEVIGALFRTDRARLLVPLWLGPRAQDVPGQSAADRVTFVVPGVPESSSPYLLLPNSLEPLDNERVAGGIRITIKEFGPTSLIALTQDPNVLGFLVERARQLGPQIVRLERELADIAFRTVQSQHAELMRCGPFIFPAESWFRLAAQELSSADRAIGVGDYPAAYRHIHRAVRPLLLIRRVDWEALTSSLERIVAWPAATSFSTLLAHARWKDVLANARPGENLLPGGTFEEGEGVTALGWQPYQHAVPGVFAQVEVSPAAARGGRFGLLVSSRATEVWREKALVESAPIWIDSPPVQVSQGDWVCFEGWISISRPITGSVDGLMIVDSLGGEALAPRVSRTVGWQPFRLYRRASEGGPVRITFVLTGIGEVCLDDVAIRILEPSIEPASPSPRDQPLVPIIPRPLAKLTP